MSSVDEELSESDRRALRQREKARREALWKIQSLRPGDPTAADFLTLLDEIESEDLTNPIGPADALQPDEVRDRVPLTHVGRFRVVRDEDIPQPWVERFNQASFLSTRLKEGHYSHDWHSFIKRWILEAKLVTRHRDARGLWSLEAQRWKLLQQLSDLEGGDPAALSVLENLEQLLGLDEMDVLPLALVNEKIQSRLVGDDLPMIWDSWIPLPWNLRLAHYVCISASARGWWRMEQWEGFLEAWDACEAQVAKHSQHLQHRST